MTTTTHATLVDALRSLRSETTRGYTFLNRKLEPEHWSFAALVREAERRGAALLTAGVAPGERLALILPEGRDFVLSFLGAVAAGIVPVPMYPPTSLARAAAYLETTRAILASCGARHLLTTAEGCLFAGQLRGPGAPLEAVLAVEQLDVAEEPACILGSAGREPRPDDPCFLQYTSGSTALPKGVVVSHANVVANGLAIMRDGLASDPARDRGLSWLPLYHDMGLVGFVLAPLLVGVPVVFVPTLAFVKQPSIWLRLVSEYRATITFGPNFAFGLCAKRGKQEEPLELSQLRVLGCGAEPINPDTIREFLELYRPHGLDPNALIACYGMAEATLAISFERLDRPFCSVHIDRAAYFEQKQIRAPARASQAPTLEVASCGYALPGHEVRVVADDGRALPEGSLGEVVFRGPSATRGYFGDELATRELLRDGWLHTGDLGFVLDGRLYISGRKKDVIIVHGRNYYPQAIEWEVERVDGVRAGTAVAFSSTLQGEERAIVVAEARPGADPELLRHAIGAQLAQALGLAAGRVILVKQGAVPRTTSGKVQRAKARALFEAGSLSGASERAVSAGVRALGGDVGVV